MNAVKYLTAVGVVVFATLYHFIDHILLLSFWVSACVISGIFNFYWDIVYDWGLGKRTSRNPFLRNKLIYPRWVCIPL